MHGLEFLILSVLICKYLIFIFYLDSPDILTRQMRRLVKLFLRSSFALCLDRMRMQSRLPAHMMALPRSGLITNILKRPEIWTSHVPVSPQALTTGVRTPSIQNVAVDTMFDDVLDRSVTSPRLTSIAVMFEILSDAICYANFSTLEFRGSLKLEYLVISGS